MTKHEEAPQISVVIPVYNERSTIDEILTRVQAVYLPKEIIIVDDGSTDGTREYLQDLAQAAEHNRNVVMPPHGGDGTPEYLRDQSESTGHGSALMTLPQTGNQLHTDEIRIFFQERNRGKGAALRRGFLEARGEIVLVQDADLEYDPQDYYKLLEPIQRGLADAVFGSRFLGGPHRVLYFWHYVGNKVLTTVSNMLTNLNLSDVWTCYKAFKREVLQKIELREDRFGFEPEVTAQVAKGNWRIYEVPISYYGRTYAEGKKITWKDGVRGIWCILRYNLFN